MCFCECISSMEFHGKAEEVALTGVEKFKECHFNIYLADKYWTWVDEFWAASDFGLSVGGIQTFKAGEFYSEDVRIKRMS